MFSLDLSSRVPIFEQLYNNIVRLISAGVLKPHDKLPPVRAMATELSVNPNTVAKAYKLLEADGYICSAVGKGTFISPDLSVSNAEKKLALNKLEKEVRRSISAGASKEEILEIIDRWCVK